MVLVLLAGFVHPLWQVRARLMCACEPSYVRSLCRETQADEDYIEHLPEPPEPVYAEGEGE